MATDINALKDAIKLAVDVVHAGVKFAEDKQIADFQPLFADIIVLLPEVGEIPVEIKDLDAQEISLLLEELEKAFGASGDKLSAIIAAALKLLADISTVIYPDIKLLIEAAKK